MTSPTDPLAREQSHQQQQNPEPVPQNGQVRRQRKPREPFLPPEVMGILVPSLKVGTGAAVGGMWVGYIGGIGTGTSPGLFAMASGFQWFTLGASYYASRLVIFKAWGGHENLSALDKVKASTMAGSFSGMMGGLLRGPRNILPGIIIGSLVGAGGQAVGGTIGSLNWGTKFLASKFSPVTPLTDRQYEKMLEEKLLKIEAELSIVDDNIKAVREGALARSSEDTKP